MCKCKRMCTVQEERVICNGGLIIAMGNRLVVTHECWIVGMR